MSSLQQKWNFKKPNIKIYLQENKNKEMQLVSLKKKLKKSFFSTGDCALTRVNTFSYLQSQRVSNREANGVR